MFYTATSAEPCPIFPGSNSDLVSLRKLCIHLENHGHDISRIFLYTCPHCETRINKTPTICAEFASVLFRLRQAIRGSGSQAVTMKSRRSARLAQTLFHGLFLDGIR
jgi:hypothetical protein